MSKIVNQMHAVYLSSLSFHVSLICFSWKIVVHGCIDGDSRVVTFLHASDNNKASTVLAYFDDATKGYV